MSAVAFSTLDARPSISLEEINSAAALQTRVDRKYVVGAGLAAEVVASFDAEIRVLEMLGRRSFTYDSVYFDTPGLDSYLLAAHGRRRRYKIRTRTYVDSATSFLEVKTEGARAATVKERIPYALSDSHHLTPEGLTYVNETLASTIGAAPSGELQAVIETGYRRTSLYLPESQGRATIDRRVTWRRPGGQAQELDGAVIIETKSGSGAGALDRHLWSHGVRPTRISKFATGLAALDPSLPANRWHRTVSGSLPLRPAGPH